MQIATDAVASWAAARPEVTQDFQHDADVHSKFWLKGYELLAALPEKPQRNPEQARAAETILNTGRESREAFLRQARAAALCGADEEPDALRARRAARLRGRRARSRPRADARAGRRAEARRCSPPRTASRSIRASSSPTCWRTRRPARISATRCCCRAPKSLARLPELQAKGAIDLRHRGGRAARQGHVSCS